MVTWSDNEVLQLISFCGEEGVQAQLEGSSTSMNRSLRHWLEMVSTSLATSAELK